MSYHARFKDKSHKSVHVLLTPELHAVMDLIHTANPSWSRNKIINHIIAQYIKNNYNVINDLGEPTDDET